MSRPWDGCRHREHTTSVCWAERSFAQDLESELEYAPAVSRDGSCAAATASYAAANKRLLFALRLFSMSAIVVGWIGNTQ